MKENEQEQQTAAVSGDGRDDLVRDGFQTIVDVVQDLVTGRELKKFAEGLTDKLLDRLESVEVKTRDKEYRFNFTKDVFETVSEEQVDASTSSEGQPVNEDAA